MIEQIIPFRYLTPRQREALSADADVVRYEPGDVVVRQGDRGDDRVFLLLRGSVRVFDVESDLPGQASVVRAGHYIGERAALFDEARALQIEAVEPVEALAVPGPRFLRLVHESTAFAQSLGSILRDKQGIFTPFSRFRAALFDSVARGSVDLARLLPLYEGLRPALHPHASSPVTLDVGALAYAVRRLPENVTRTLSFYLTETLPALYTDPDRRFVAVPTAARRRAGY